MRRDGFLDVDTGPGPNTENNTDDRNVYTFRGQYLLTPSDKVSCPWQNFPRSLESPQTRFDGISIYSQWAVLSGEPMEERSRRIILSRAGLRPPNGTVRYFDPDQNLPCTRTGAMSICSNM